MLRKLMPFILIITLIFIGAWKIFNGNSNNKNHPTPQKQSDKLIVVTTLFPLYDIAKNIGGNLAEVSLLLPPGLEAHSFEPKPSDLVKINEADIFIYTGDFMEAWVADILSGVSNKNLKIVEASQNIALHINGTEQEDADAHKEEVNHEDEDGHEEEHKEDDDHKSHNHIGIDPHIWLDFDNLKIITDNITAAFINKDAANENLFTAASQAYKEQINTLDLEYQNILAKCKTRRLIYSGHYAFAYLTDKYNLEYQSAYGLSPNSEPSVQELIEIIKQIKNNNLDYIFHEELLNPRLAETLQRETGVKTLNLSPAHNLSKEQLAANKSLLSVFQENLQNLAIGLKCQ